MSIIGVEHVEAAHGPIDVLAGDVVTPLARERAADLGIELRRIPGDSSARGAPSPGRPALSSATSRPGSSQIARGRTPLSSATSRPRTSSAGVLNRNQPDALSGGITRRDLDAAPRSVSGAALNTLYRRGAPVGATLAPRTTSGPAASGPDGNRPRAAVIGAGHVGSIATLRLAESDLFSEVLLIDVVEGLAAGVALDLWHSAGLGAFATTIVGATSLADLAGTDYVIITAGKARKPGMTRTDLTQANAEIVGPIAEAIAANAPQAVIVVVTNPLEEMTHLAQLRSGFPPERVLGMAGVLDTARFAALVGLTGVCRPDEVSAFALGSHGPEMVIPLSQASGQGKPLVDLLDHETLDAITARARDSGAEIVSLLKTGSAYFAPGQSAARMVIAMATSSSEIMACAVVPHGQYGLHDTRVGLPARLGPGGLVEIVTLDLVEDELAALRVAADSLGERIREVG